MGRFDFITKAVTQEDMKNVVERIATAPSLDLKITEPLFLEIPETDWGTVNTFTKDKFGTKDRNDAMSLFIANGLVEMKDAMRCTNSVHHVEIVITMGTTGKHEGMVKKYISERCGSYWGESRFDGVLNNFRDCDPKFILSETGKNVKAAIMAGNEKSRFYADADISCCNPIPGRFWEIGVRLYDTNLIPNFNDEDAVVEWFERLYFKLDSWDKVNDAVEKAGYPKKGGYATAKGRGDWIPLRIKRKQRNKGG